jgi:hypothetical protein
MVRKNSYLSGSNLVIKIIEKKPRKEVYYSEILFPDGVQKGVEYSKNRLNNLSHISPEDVKKIKDDYLSKLSVRENKNYPRLQNRIEQIVNF